MSFARTWPKLAENGVFIEDLNDLNQEINARAGVANAAFAECTSLRDAVVALHSRINSVIQAKFAEPATGYKWCTAGQAELTTGAFIDRRLNPWKAVFGGARSNWLRNGAGGEGGTPDDCEEPHCLFVNEIYTFIIGAMKWRYAIPISAGKVFRSSGDVTAETSKQDALDTAWTRYGAADAAEGGTDATFYADWRTDAGSYYFNVVGTREFTYLALGPIVLAAKCFLWNLWASFYYADVEGVETLIAAPAWDLDIYIGTTNPAPLGAADWDYGALSGTIEIDQLGNMTDLDPALSTALVNFAPDATNYLQLRAGDAQKPQCAVDSGFWAAWWDNLWQWIQFSSLRVLWQVAA
jgi:hypothetical protein